MKKKYSTRSLSYTVSIKVDGKLQHITFEKLSSNFKGLSYITDDEKIQKALESTKAFGNSFILDKKYKSEEEFSELKNEGQTPPVNKLTEKSFTTVNEAKDFFNKEHGVPVSKLMTRAAIISEAEKLGFEVQFDNQ